MAKEVHSKQEYQFNPDGALWDVDSERAILAAGQRAILMQIAHPLVAKGVSDHSRFKKEPIDRLNHTLQLTGALVFGTRDE